MHELRGARGWPSTSARRRSSAARCHAMTEAAGPSNRGVSREAARPGCRCVEARAEGGGAHVEHLQNLLVAHLVRRVRVQIEAVVRRELIHRQVAIAVGVNHLPVRVKVGFCLVGVHLEPKDRVLTLRCETRQARRVKRGTAQMISWPLLANVPRAAAVEEVSAGAPP